MFPAQRVSGPPCFPAGENPVKYTCVDGEERSYTTRDLEDLSHDIKEKIRYSIANAKKLKFGTRSEDVKFINPEDLKVGGQKNAVLLGTRWVINWEPLEDPKGLILELKEAVKPWPVSNTCNNAFINCPYIFTTVIAIDSACWKTSSTSQIREITYEFVAPEDIKLSLGGVGLSQGSSIKIMSLDEKSLIGLSEGEIRGFPAKVSIMEGEFTEKKIAVSCHNAKIYIGIPLMAEVEKVDVAGDILAKHQKELPLSIGEGNVYFEFGFIAVSGGVYPPVSADMMLPRTTTVVRRPGEDDYILNTEEGMKSLSID